MPSHTTKSGINIGVTATGMAVISPDELERIGQKLMAFKDAEKALPIDEWEDDFGDCLWWAFPVEEPPYCGTPLDCDFPSQVTHFTKLIIPKEPS